MFRMGTHEKTSSYEKDVMRYCYLTSHPVDNYKFEIKHFCQNNVSELPRLSKQGQSFRSGRGCMLEFNKIKNKEVIIGGIIVAANHRVSKNGKNPLICIEDYSDSFEMMVFGEDYVKFKGYLQEGYFVQIRGLVQERFRQVGNWGFELKNIQLLSDLRGEALAKSFYRADSNFEELVLKSDKPVLVDFWAEWCGPCRMVGPLVEEIAKEYEGKAVVGKLMWTSNPENVQFVLATNSRARCAVIARQICITQPCVTVNITVYRAMGSSAVADSLKRSKENFRCSEAYPKESKDTTWLKEHVSFTGEVLLGHLRYGTHGKNSIESCHPFLRQNNWMSRNLVVAGNFNMTNVDELLQQLYELGQHPKEKADTVTVLEKIGHFLDDENQELFDKFKKEDYSNVANQFHLIAKNLECSQIFNPL
ncbi:hypothetical protein FQR65_LT16757 [Abscondita terminalis]|nr:hypothetical protein FQR65_LT16757 [Abscondita terminalis]